MNDWLEQYRCPKCRSIMNLAMGHISNPNWEGVYCPSCGYHNPPLIVTHKG